MLATRNLLKRRLASTNALLAVVCLAQFMVILDVSIVNIALPSIRNGLHFSTTGLQWVVNAYTLTFAGLLMLGGRSADLLGRRRVFLAGTAAEVTAVREIGAHRFTPGAITETLMKDYDRLVLQSPEEVARAVA